MKKRDFQDFLVHFYAGFVMLVTFGVYVKTLAPTVSFFDSGELISAAHTLGVAHPPGYPLYVLLGWFFSRLPVGNVAYRLNLMSAFFASLAALMGYYITYTIVSQRSRNHKSQITNHKSQIKNSPSSTPERMLYPVVSMCASFMFAFSVTHWKHAVLAEVYSLNAFLCGLVLLLLLEWRYAWVAADKKVIPPGPPLEKEGKGVPSPQSPVPSPQSPVPRRFWLLYLAALIFGLGFGNHQTIATWGIAAAFLVILTMPRILVQWKKLGFILLCLLFGLQIYLLVPIRATTNPPINWGNPVTWKQFLWLVKREGYKYVDRGNGLKRLWDDLKNPAQSSSEEETSPQPSLREEQGIVKVFKESLFFQQLATCNPLREFGAFGVILAVMGLGYCLLFHRVVGATMLIAILTLLLVMVVFGDPPEENVFLLEEFHTPSYLLMAVWIGLGAMAIVRAVLWVASESRPLQYAMVFVLAVFLLVPPGIQMWQHMEVVDRSRNYVAYDYATNIMDSLQPDAILFTWGDSGAFPLWYLQFVEGKRPDVTLIHVPHLGTEWYVELLPQELFISEDPFHKYEGNLASLIDEIVQRNWRFRPIYFDFSSSHSLNIPYHLIPHGITYKVAIEGDFLDEDVWNRYRFRGLLSFLFTEESFEQLRGAGVPEQVVNTLHVLAGQYFLEERPFLAAVEQLIGAEQTRQYKELFLLHAYRRPRIALDPDVRRTFSMYGSARIELGNFYLDLGDVEKASEQFNAAVRLEESLGESIVQMLQFRDKMYGSHVPDTKISEPGQLMSPNSSVP